ncbi:MAG: (p)ppGpp synthetase SpoT/RelA [Bryobacterales bacterium]|nr:(p)ppGpp synthetase SpoT/RelA [Bryobacterales bacterium]
MPTSVLDVPQVEGLYRTLEDQIRALRPGEDLEPIHRAYVFAAERHSGQKRKSGEPYVTHPIAVAKILTDMQMDMVCLQTGLLHDLVEDTGVKLQEIEERFGPDVARCVDGVTKLSKISLANREDRQAESLRKMLLAMTGDIRVIIVKLADRLHNMRTLQSLPPERQVAIAQETIDIYSPIAHRLGMGKVRGELEDLAFRTLEPAASAELMREIDSKRQDNEEWLRQTQREIEQGLAKEGVNARVEGRVKRAYSVYLKLKRQKIALDQVYDLVAVRIVTQSVKDCYAALGVIHNEWHPIPGRIKDFIAMPRPNLYQSLHTSVIGPGGLAFEVQIRTEEMHRVAEEGIAAHWKYKEGNKNKPGQDDARIAWLRQLVEWQRDMRDSTEFLSTLRVDLYPEEVYTFTPRGRVVVLPRGATPIDFAYAVHSDVGTTCMGARVNGTLKPLKYMLRNGDVVEILTQQGHQPSKDWLSMVKTSRARNRIKHVINANERAKAVEIGQKSLEKEARRLGLNFGRISSGDLETVASEYGVSKTEDLYAALGFGKFSARQVLQKVAPDEVVAATAVQPVAKPTPVLPSSPIGDGDLTIHVKGVNDVMIYRAKCCNPIRGEQIVGYITRGKGVAVHSVQCTNVQNLMYEAERKIDVEWARTGQEPLPVKIVVYTDDRPGILHQLTSILSNEASNIRTLEARADETRSDESAVVDLTIDVKDKKQLERVVTAFRRIPGVRDIERVLTA